MKKIAFYTLGCKLNFSETSTISDEFVERGYQKVDFEENPDVFVINTCSVTDNANKKCRKIIREARAISPDAFVAVIGCYAQLKPKEIINIPGVDIVAGAGDKFNLPTILENFEKNPERQVFDSDINEVTEFKTSASLNDRTRTFLKVQDGCNYNCSFCTIPLARGKSRSDTIENVVSKANELGVSGVKEIVLTGVNTGDFGIRNGKREDRFIDLVKELDNVESVSRFRISSIEPNLLTDEVIEFTSMSKRFMPHFHIPLQSGSDVLLASMKRRYRTDLYTQRVTKIKELIPDACIGVDVIVGYPGETEEEFQKTYDYLMELPISYLHVFTYSERENTPAAEMDAVVSVPERARRSNILRKLSELKRRKFYNEQLGKEFSLLTEDDLDDDYIYGFTENYLRVGLPKENYSSNTVATVYADSILGNGKIKGLIPQEQKES